jgi:hypothetical protein
VSGKKCGICRSTCLARPLYATVVTCTAFPPLQFLRHEASANVGRQIELAQPGAASDGEISSGLLLVSVEPF